MSLLDIRVSRAKASRKGSFRSNFHRRSPWAVEASEAPTLRLYRTREGDDLQTIAKRFYGDRALWKVLHAANARELGGSRELRAGQILYIPDLD